MEEKRKRGRPPTFQSEDRKRFAELIRQHGIRGTIRISEVPICNMTLIKIAREFGISLKMGKRKKAA